MKKLSLTHAAAVLGICLFVTAPAKAQEVSLDNIPTHASHALEQLNYIDTLSTIHTIDPNCDIVDLPGQQRRAVNCGPVALLEPGLLHSRFSGLKQAFSDWLSTTEAVISFLAQGGLGEGYVPNELKSNDLSVALESAAADAQDFFLNWPLTSQDSANLTRRLQSFNSLVIKSSELYKIRKALRYLEDENFTMRLSSERKREEDKQNASGGWFKGCSAPSNRYPPR